MTTIQLRQLFNVVADSRDYTRLLNGEEIAGMTLLNSTRVKTLTHKTKGKILSAVSADGKRWSVRAADGMCSRIRFDM